jgi:hypothetical protein
LLRIVIVREDEPPPAAARLRYMAQAIDARAVTVRPCGAADGPATSNLEFTGLTQNLGQL